jgi:hypothetical protein
MRGKTQWPIATAIIEEKGMNDTTLRNAVMDTLEAWPGFASIRAAMKDLPGVKVYLGGGAVRRLLLGEDRAVKDFDLFLDGPCQEQLVQRLGKAGVIRRTPYGSPRWFPSPGGSPYADLIHVRRFSNGLWKCRNMLDAMNQFDCTVNAVAVELRTGAVLDPQHGRRDAARRIARAVRFDLPARPIRPGMRVTHAGALWLRIVHYALILGLQIEPHTWAWLGEHRPPQTEVQEFAQRFFVPRLELARALSAARPHPGFSGRMSLA